MEWLVLLEAERSSHDGIDGPDFRRLLHALAEPAPGGLHSADRYALQMAVDAADPPEAIAAAVRRWQRAHREVAVPPGRLVRVEAMTPEEFEREWLFFDGDGGEAAWPPPVAEVSPRGVEDALLRHAFHDPLTDLAGQGLFRDRLEHALTGERCAVVLLDIDRFGELNGRLGRRAGDDVLVAVAERLRHAAGGPKAVGRLGGDQFGVILHGGSAAEAASAAGRILEEASAAMAVDGGQVHTTLSGGVALGEPGRPADDVLHRATLALRRAQEQGGGRVETYADGMAGADVSRLVAEREAMASPDTTGYLGLLERLSVAVAECPTLEDAGTAVLRQFCNHAGFPLGRLYLPDAANPSRPCPARTWTVGPPERFGDFGHDSGRRPLRGGEGVAGRALDSGRPVWVTDIASEPGLGVPHEAVAAGLRGALAVPVVVEDRTVAVLEFFADQTIESGDAPVQLLAAVGAHLATAARRARAEEAARAAEASLRILLGHSGVRVNLLNPNGRLLEQYPAAWPDDVPLPLSAVDLVHPDDIATVLRGWADALEAPGPHRPFECRVAMPDGSWRWLEVTAMNMLDEPDIGAVVAYSREIGDRKRLEEERRQAVAHLGDAEALARLGTWRADLLTGESHWSDEMYRILGLEPGAVEPARASLLALAHPDDRADLQERQRLAHGGAVQRFVFRVVEPGGAIRWISGQARPSFDGAGRVVSVQGTVQDVTEHKARERTLLESEQRLRELESIAGVGSWRTDAATKSTVWSQQLYGILGVDPDAVSPGMDSLMACVHPDDRPAVEAHALLQLRLALPVDFECRIVRPDGRPLWVRIQLTVSYDVAGAVVAFHGLLWDATGRTPDRSRVGV